MRNSANCKSLTYSSDQYPVTDTEGVKKTFVLSLSCLCLKQFSHKCAANSISILSEGFFQCVTHKAQCVVHYIATIEIVDRTRVKLHLPFNSDLT